MSMVSRVPAMFYTFVFFLFVILVQSNSWTCSNPPPTLSVQIPAFSLSMALPEGVVSLNSEDGII